MGAAAREAVRLTAKARLSRRNPWVIGIVYRLPAWEGQAKGDEIATAPVC
jgi:hypothetical protein